MHERTKPEGQRDGSALAPLAHPLFLAALVLLVVNDHLLKGNLHGFPWLTGKLSDFTGLLVAPVMLAALLGARSRGARALAIAAPSALFAALQLSPAFAALYDGTLADLGLASRTVSDPTDLVALAMLPLAWHILAESDRTPANARLRSLGRPAAHALAGASLFACIATTAPPGPGPTTGFFQTSAAVANLTAEPIDVRIRWAEVSLDCDDVEVSELARLVPREAFGSGVTFALEPEETAPIEQVAALAALSGDFPSSAFAPGCEIALLSVDGLDETIVLWNATSRSTVPTAIASASEVSSPLAAIVSSGGVLAVEASGLLAQPIADPLPMAPECGGWGEPIVTSELSGLEGALEVQEVATTLDGCTSLVLRPFALGALPDDPVEYGTARRIFLCGIADLWSFDVGERFDFSRTALELRFQGWDDDRALIVFRDVTRLSAGPFDISVRPGAPTCWRRDACGAYLRAAELAPTDFARLTPSLAVGQVSETVDEDGRRARIFVARADTVVAGLVGCDGSRDAPQTLLDAAVAIDATMAPTEPAP